MANDGVVRRLHRDTEARVGFVSALHVLVLALVFLVLSVLVLRAALGGPNVRTALSLVTIGALAALAHGSWPCIGASDGSEPGRAGRPSRKHCFRP